MSGRSRIAVGIIFFALMFFYLCLRAYLGGVAPQYYSRRDWVAEWRDGRAVVVSVGMNSPATGVVREGDVIDAIWSEHPDATPPVMPGVWRKRLRAEAEEWREFTSPLATPGLWRVPPGTRYKLTVSRDGRSLEFSLHTSRVFTNMPSGWPFVYVTLTFLLFLTTGATVFLLKPGDEQAWLLALILTTPVALFPLNFYIQLPGWVYLTALLTQILSTVFFPAILRFFLVFPERSPMLRRFPRLEGLIYLPYILFLLPFFTLGRVLTGFQLTPAWLEPFMRSEGTVGGGLMVAYMLAGLIAMAVNYRAMGAASRRKLRVVMIGSGAGFLNILLMPFGELVGLKRALPAFWSWLDVGLLFTVPLIPLSFAYAIIRHKVIPVSLIIRRGARYMLVSRGSAALEAIAAAVVVLVLLSATQVYL